MKNTKNNPCSHCPFRKTSLPGWLGGIEPRKFLEQALNESGSPCHIDLEALREYWDQEMLENDDLEVELINDLIEKDVEQCAGALAFGTIMGKSWRNEKMENQRKIIGKLKYILNVNEFLKHHEEADNEHSN